MYFPHRKVKRHCTCDIILASFQKSGILHKGEFLSWKIPLPFFNMSKVSFTVHTVSC